MPRNIHNNYYEDTYVKHECQICRRSFIVGERLSEGMELSCPYCRSSKIEAISAANEDKLEDMDMGCLGIYYHIYKNENLMLYTQNEFSLAMKEFFERTGLKEIALGGHRKILNDFCMKRDNVKPEKSDAY